MHYCICLAVPLSVLVLRHGEHAQQGAAHSGHPHDEVLSGLAGCQHAAQAVSGLQSERPTQPHYSPSQATCCPTLPLTDSL